MHIIISPKKLLSIYTEYQRINVYNKKYLLNGIIFAIIIKNMNLDAWMQ